MSLIRIDQQSSLERNLPLFVSAFIAAFVEMPRRVIAAGVLSGLRLARHLAEGSKRFGKYR